MFNSNHTLFVIKLRLASWINAKWPLSNGSILALCKDPSLASVALRSKPSPTSESWTPPPFGSLKFNVDGSAHGKLGSAGKWDVFCD
ncbi:hypothetical protein REPUB_Repub02eG0194300 [Reevesia pubescens]